ncbi:hypothetical protein MP638_002908 [Amoeboaphelidium occidentale]|nr:hypothetical protein MP638_002908 [Amoeboaphelidium occidentale]
MSSNNAQAEDGGWKFAQCFGDKGEVEEITEADIISAVEFDKTGDYLATGDKGGRVVLFERNKQKKNCEYKFYTEFQSHEAEFDYLKSVEIEEKINKIKWCKRPGNFHLLLSTNDKTIKLWKVYDKTVKAVTESQPLSQKTLSKGIQLPKLAITDSFTAAQPKRVFGNAHTYHINSISINTDGETFISADDLRINLWNLGVSDQSFNIVDIKPVNMEELTEVITAAEFHPIHCNVFMYSSSKGTIKVGDMRQSALCDQHAKVFEEEDDDSTQKSFFNEILSSVNDIKFSPDGRYILSRDYLTLKLWDLNMESKPVKTFNVHDYVRPKLVDLYDNECLFDKFECFWSGDGKHVMTGSYSNYFHIYDRNNAKSEVSLQADKSAFKARRTGTTKSKLSLGRLKGKKDEINPDTVDYQKKILHASWHPNEYSVAVAATNNLFLFSTL